jgi:NADH:ubiquinone oxidoreductase subunit 5 (subunit L)/multisubunit Na+/H+ antiporter MnhA subunit
MNLPVAILILPTIAIGWLMFGGDASPWTKFFAGEFPAGHPLVLKISELMTSSIVLVVVLIGFGIAYVRYGTRSAQEGAVERLRTESVRMPAVLTNAFYFDAALDLIFVRSAQLLGTLFSRVVDPHVIDGTVREAAFSARWLGVLTQSLQTGLVRAYALILVFGAACFIVYYALAGVPH